MNELILKIAEQAEILITEVGAFHNTPQGAYQLKEQHMKKFAELIIQECIDELDGKIYNAIDHEGDETWPDLILKEHFGVEE